jgi:addiction module HigA family antidote
MITLEGVDPRMIANNLEPYRPVHPGELLKEEVEYRGLSKRKLAGRMGISYTELKEILKCKRAVTTEYAMLFEAALGIDADLWINMQVTYNKQTAKRNKSFIERLDKIRSEVLAEAAGKGDTKKGKKGKVAELQD